MRKKKDKHEEPVYAKNSSKHNQRSKSKHSILHKHDQRVAEFRNKDERIKTIDTKLRNLEKEMDKLSKTLALAPNTEISMAIAKQLQILENEIQQLKEKRSVIVSGQDEIDYLLDSAFLIAKYSELELQEHEILLKATTTQEDTAKLNSVSYQKAQIIDEYLLKFEDNHISNLNTFIKNNTICPECNVYFQIEAGFLVCPDCGLCQSTLDSNGDLSFKEKQDYDYRPQFTYDKMTHLEDWLRRFQAKENRVIPQEILDKVILEAKKERMKDLNQLTEEKVKRYLKKLNLNEYYDNVIGIINRINGRPPFTLTTEIEEKIKTMFQQIQEPFERHKPANRRNFLSYSYCLHKFFQILGLQEFSRYFPLLKSADKLRQQDDIFKKVVSEMATKDKSVNWVFYPSI
jgi:hypothetical protein